jgi:uncharacterized protein YndB with AHSA1/START domain
MSGAGPQPATPADDAVRVTVSVNVAPAHAFEVFTQQIDLWWRRGGQYRHFGGERALIAIEPHEGGRVFESLGEAGPVHELGRVLAWQPPLRLAFEWRLANFAPDERTEVEVTFEPLGAGTKVTVTHRGWAAIRADHPVRHGEAAAAFIGTIGRWWADQLRIYRMRATA